LRRKPDAADGWLIVRHVFLDEALRKIARREWSARWYETGELAGVLLSPPPASARELVRIRCGSVECLKSWVLGAKPETKKVRVKAAPSPLRVLLDFFDVDGEKLRRVSAELALKKIDRGIWKAIWCENGDLAGVAEA
jgi:hypothetical protein